MKKHQFLWFTSLILATLFVFVLGAWLRFLYVPVVTEGEGFHYILHPGESVRTFAQDLSRKNLLKHPFLFKVLLHLRGEARELKAGEYHFPKGTSLSGMVDRMVAGSGTIYRSFIIIPGQNFEQIRHEILDDNKLHHDIANLNDGEIMQHLGNPIVEIEGQLFPDTYYFLEGSSDLALLKRAYQVMQERLNKAWETRDANLPFQNPYQALIAASLIEREAYLNEERPIIAGVLVNRLRKDMLLQFDPTVIYGMGAHYDGSIHKKNLRADTPYNTYVHKGLPPTPIAMPSLASIIAALHPVQHDYLYFVARGDGSHQFSKTLEEHNKAVASAGKLSAPFFNAKLLEYYLLKYWLPSFIPKGAITMLALNSISN